MLLQRHNSKIERANSFSQTICRRRSETIPRLWENDSQLFVRTSIIEYLLNRKFRLRTDPRVLAWLLSKKLKASARISGWLTTLIRYQIVIKYVLGIEKCIADAYSNLDSMAIDN